MVRPAAVLARSLPQPLDPGDLGLELREQMVACLPLSSYTISTRLTPTPGRPSYARGGPPAPRHGAQGGVDGRFQYRDIVVQERWKWIHTHNVSPARYMGMERDGGLRRLSEELQAENSGFTSQLRTGGLRGQSSVPGSRKGRRAPLQWWPLSQAKRLSAAFADVKSGSSGSDTTLTYTRRRDQMPFVAGAVVGAISPHTARP